MLLLLLLLPNNSMDNCFQNILFRKHAFHVLNQFISLIHLIILKIVDHQIQARFWNYIEQGWQNLKRVLACPERHEVVSQKIVILEDISRSRCVLKLF